jgi:hypothetical protein
VNALVRAWAPGGQADLAEWMQQRASIEIQKASEQIDVPVSRSVNRLPSVQVTPERPTDLMPALTLVHINHPITLVLDTGSRFTFGNLEWFLAEDLMREPHALSYQVFSLATTYDNQRMKMPVVPYVIDCQAELGNETFQGVWQFYMVRRWEQWPMSRLSEVGILGRQNFIDNNLTLSINHQSAW